MLKRSDAFFVLVDVQGKLAYQIHESLSLIRHLKALIQSLQKLDIPIIVLEQYPKGLGPTIAELARELNDYTPIEKITFNGCFTPAFIDEIAKTGRNQAIVAGIEAHVCVYQTVCGLLENGYSVDVITDGISSRTAANKLIGIERMKDAGAKMSSTEMALFELMVRADEPMNKDVIQIIKKLL
ncbi:MAG TPA: hydrolase [Bacilli bacterium]|nr:hydrolase [Bacilli bacterium]